MNLSYIAILNIKGSNYCCIITEISQSQSIKSLQNIYLTEKRSIILKPNTKSNFKAVNLLQILI